MPTTIQPNSQKLVEAVEKGDLNRIERQLGRGDNPDSCNSEGESVVVMAAEKNDWYALRRLLKEGKANPDVYNKDGVPALVICARDKRNENIEALLVNGGNPNLTDSQGNTVLTASAEERHNTAIGFLLAQGVNPNHANDAGKTALMIFAENGDSYAVGQFFTPYVKSELECDVDINILNHDGNSAISLARNNGHTEIAERLEREKIIAERRQEASSNTSLDRLLQSRQGQSSARHFGQ